MDWEWNISIREKTSIQGRVVYPSGRVRGVFTGRYLSARCILLWVFVLSAVSVFVPERVVAEVVGSFTFVRGRVDILRVGEKRAVSVKAGDEVSVGDIVRTKSRSRAQITFKDGSRLNIAQRSRVEIKEFMFEPDGEKRSCVLRGFRGRLRTVVPGVFKGEGSRFEVETPTAVAAVRGTDFFVIIKPLATDVMVVEGVVGVRNIDPSVVGEVFLRAYQATTVELGRPPMAPRTITPGDVAPHLQDTAPQEGETDQERDVLPEVETEKDITDMETVEEPGVPVTDEWTEEPEPPIVVPISETREEVLSTPVDVKVIFPGQ